MNSDTLDVTQKSTKSAKLEKHIRPTLIESLHYGSLLIHFSDNQLSLAITKQPLQDVAKAIAQQEKFDIMFDKGMANPNIDMKFSNLPIQQGLQRLSAATEAVQNALIDPDERVRIEALHSALLAQ